LTIILLTTRELNFVKLHCPLKDLFTKEKGSFLPHGVKASVAEALGAVLEGLEMRPGGGKSWIWLEAAGRWMRIKARRGMCGHDGGDDGDTEREREREREREAAMKPPRQGGAGCWVYCCWAR